MQAFFKILPYGVWMALMALLPQTAGAYAVRSAACAVCLCVAAAALRRRAPEGGERAGLAAWTRGRARGVFCGIAAGILVWMAWVAPETSALYREWCVIGETAISAPSPYDPAVCGWPLTLARLAGSAFVIAAAEELFFRDWLYGWLGADWKAFAWMVALFAVEHNRPVVAALAGAAYGLIALRRGLGAAIVAHMTTNLALGIQVVATGDWAFW